MRNIAKTRNHTTTFPDGLTPVDLYRKVSLQHSSTFSEKLSDMDKRRENGRNVTSFWGMVSVASNMGWL